MNHVSFGSVLKEARIRKGYELTTVARRLRIRPDIIQAIENSDFANIPSSGYARNMINAYARLLDIDSNEVTRMYLDEVYAYRVGRAYQDATQTRYQNRNTSSTTSRPSAAAFEKTSSWQREKVSSKESGINSLGRRTYSSRDAMPTYQRPTSSRQTQQSTPHRSRRPAVVDGKYGNMVSSAPASYVKRSKLPFVIAGIVVAIVLIIVFAVTSCSNQPEEQQNIPVTGVESKKTSEQEVVQETAPTEFTFSYQVAEGSSAWIEVYVNDEQKEAGEVDGPASKEYAFSSKIEFVAGSSEGVSVSINGEAQTISANENGIVSVTYTFEEFLEKWYAAHPNAKKSSSSTTASTTTSATSSTTSSSTQKSTSSSSSSSTNSVE